jgi:sulfonate transport system substrate-binding protein
MSITKIAALAFTAILALSLPGCSGGDDTRTLVIGYQDNGLPKLVEASGVLKGAPYKVRWAILSGPAANLSALYSKKIDIGHMGDTSLTVEQSNAARAWAADNTPLKIVAGWRRASDPNYPQIVTAVRTSSKINSPADLRGHKWAYNFGGYNHAQYLASLARAKLTEADIKPIKFGDSNSAAAAFTAGETDVYSGGLGPILTALDSGEAKILLSDNDTRIPALSVWTARTDVLKDSTKDKNLKDFFARMSGYWTWHARHLGQVKQTLKDVLKQSDRRAEWEASNRQARFYRLDQELVTKEQKVADVLFQGKGIKKKVNVTFEYDPRYNDAQKAVSVDGQR